MQLLQKIESKEAIQKVKKLNQFVIKIPQDCKKILLRLGDQEDSRYGRSYTFIDSETLAVGEKNIWCNLTHQVERFLISKQGKEHYLIELPNRLLVREIFRI